MHLWLLIVLVGPNYRDHDGLSDIAELRTAEAGRCEGGPLVWEGRGEMDALEHRTMLT